MNCEKFRVAYSPGVFKLSPTNFRIWVSLERHLALRQLSYQRIGQEIGMDPETISAAMPKIAETYKEQKATGFLPEFLITTCLSHKAVKVLAWFWILANEGASNRVYLTDEDIAERCDLSESSVAAVRKEITGRFVTTELLTQRHRYMIRKPSQRLLNALTLHASCTQFTLLNPETGQPVKEQPVEPIGFGIQLTNRILSRFGFHALQALEEPGLRILPNGDQLFVWHSGGWSLRKHGTRSRSEKGKRQVGKGNVFELYRLLSGCAPEEASNAVRYLDATKPLLKKVGIDVAKLDREVLGTPMMPHFAASKPKEEHTNQEIVP